MIEGIEVLSETQVANSDYVAVTAIGTLLFLLLGIVIASVQREKPAIIIMTVSVVLSIIFMVSGVIYCGAHLHSRYEVVISEDVNFKEFYDKYDLIKTRGQIYIIEEKENNYDGF